MAVCLCAVTEPATVSAPAPTQTKTPWALLRLAALFAIATLAGWLFERIGSPLPWMIGPLLVTAAIFLSGCFKVAVPLKVRPFGQMVVACQVGLTFSPTAL